MAEAPAVLVNPVAPASTMTLSPVGASPPGTRGVVQRDAEAASISTVPALMVLPIVACALITTLPSVCTVCPPLRPAGEQAVGHAGSDVAASQVGRRASDARAGCRARAGHQAEVALHGDGRSVEPPPTMLSPGCSLALPPVSGQVAHHVQRQHAGAVVDRLMRAPPPMVLYPGSGPELPPVRWTFRSPRSAAGAHG